MKKKTFVTHSVKYNGHYLGHTQAVPAFHRSPVLHSLELARYTAEVTSIKGQDKWVCPGYDVGEGDIEDAFKSRDRGLRGPLEGLFLADPAGKDVIRPDLENHSFAAPSSQKHNNQVEDWETDHRPLPVLDTWAFLKKRHRYHGKEIIPVWATKVDDDADEAVYRWDPIHKVVVSLQLLPIPISYRPLEDMASEMSCPDFDDFELDMMRNRMGARFYDLIGDRPLYISWTTPESLRGLWWDHQREMLSAEDFYRPCDDLLPSLQEWDESLESYLARDLSVLNVVDPGQCRMSDIPLV